jgi:hypothetical protein
MDKKLSNASQHFYLACLVRLEEKAQKGWKGWDNPIWKEAFEKRLKDIPQFELTQKTLVDIANYANFLWNLIEIKK